jgi:hypothetical protein
VVNRVSWHGATAIHEQRAMQPATRLAAGPHRGTRTAARWAGCYLGALKSGMRCTGLLVALVRYSRRSELTL